MTTYITSTGAPASVDQPHLAEQFIHSELSVLYFDTREDRSLLAEAALALGAHDVVEVARSNATGCKKSGKFCAPDGCLGKCEPTGGPHFATCKCDGKVEK